MDNNLIVCVTPLQMLIAERIMDIHPADYTTIIIYYDSNEKYNHYIDRIKRKSKKLLSFHVKGDTKLSRFFEIIRFKINFYSYTRQYYEYCFVASIENPFILSILGSVKFNKLHTFDDGTANININSVYHIKLNISPLERIVRNALLINLSRDDVKKMSSLHYTLYPYFKNIIEPIKGIELMGSLKKDLTEYDCSTISNENILNIFIGQPLYAEDKIFTNEYIEFILKKFNIEYYYPHPRERTVINGVEYINSDLIFEDYVLSLINVNKHIKINLYTFFSTAALNVCNIDNIQIVSFRSKYLFDKYQSTYVLFERLKNIEFIDL